MKKIYLLLTLLSIATITYAQEPKPSNLAITIQSGYTVMSSPMAGAAIMITQMPQPDDKFPMDISFGLLYNRFTDNVGHEPIQYGVMVSSGIYVFKNLGVRINIEHRSGQFYVYDEFGSHNGKLYKQSKLMGNAGIIYKVFNLVELQAGYTPIEYNPMKWVRNQQSPHSNSAIKIAASFAIPL
jgi:hypothetical protein